MNDPGAGGGSGGGAAGPGPGAGLGAVAGGAAAEPDKPAAEVGGQAPQSAAGGAAGVDAPSVGAAAAEAELLAAAQTRADQAASGADAAGTASRANAASAASAASRGSAGEFGGASVSSGAGSGTSGSGGSGSSAAVADASLARADGQTVADGQQSQPAGQVMAAATATAGATTQPRIAGQPIPHSHVHHHAKNPHGHNHHHKHEHEHTHEPGHEREHDHEHEDHFALAVITNAISANFKRALLATVFACAGLALTYASGGVLPTDDAPIRYFNSNAHRGLGVLCACVGAGFFLIFGVTAVRSATKEILKTVPDALGDHRKNGLRWFCLLVGYLLIILGTLGALDVPVERLLVGGAVTGVILGIAAQQSLGNLFAGLMLLLTRPFEIGDEVSLRSGPLGGVLTGLVADMNLTYVKLVTDHGTILLPNSSIVSASIGPPGAFG